MHKGRAGRLLIKNNSLLTLRFRIIDRRIIKKLNDKRTVDVNGIAIKFSPWQMMRMNQEGVGPTPATKEMQIISLGPNAVELRQGTIQLKLIAATGYYWL
jgi:hypothetical protein